MSNEENNNRKKVNSINPATGEIIGFSFEDTIEDLRSIYHKAKEAQKKWGSLNIKQRSKHLLLIRDYIVQNAEKISEIISKDNGKTRMDALSTEVVPAAMSATYYAKKSGKYLKRKKIPAGNILFFNKRSYVDRVPFGVIGIISPWNYPFAIPFQEIMMALIAGNSIILKVASNTQEVGKILREVIEAGRLPEGIFNMVNIPGNIAGDAFIASGINKIFFTGSVPVGKKLMAKAAERLIPVSLELGGNDAMIVCKDANLYRAASGAAWAGFSNAGQSCGGVERIYVEASVYNEFMDILRKITKSLKIGADLKYNTDIGSITTEKQLKTITEHVKDAEDKGAKLTSYPENIIKNEKGFFFAPTIIENVNDSMLTMQMETFGPVVAVEKVENISQAIEKANNSNLGLTASVWTKNRKKAHWIASNLEVGAVTINDHLMSHGLAETPWGGFKESGIGRTHSYLGLEEMTQPRVVVDDILPGVQKNMWWYPHTKQVFDGLTGVIDFLYSKKIGVKLKGMIRLINVFMRTFKK